MTLTLTLSMLWELIEQWLSLLIVNPIPFAISTDNSIWQWKSIEGSHWEQTRCYFQFRNFLQFNSIWLNWKSMFFERTSTANSAMTLTELRCAKTIFRLSLERVLFDSFESRTNWKSLSFLRAQKSKSNLFVCSAICLKMQMSPAICANMSLLIIIIIMGSMISATESIFCCRRRCCCHCR